MSAGAGTQLSSFNHTYAAYGNYTITVSGTGYDEYYNGFNNVPENNPIYTTVPVTVSPVAPGIASQPANQSVALTSNATFSVTATGSQPRYYQWFFNSAAIAGATNSSLTVSNAGPSSPGGYLVVITNLAGGITSSVASLAISPLDTSFGNAVGFNNSVRAIAQQPDGRVIVAGDFTSCNGTNRNHIARLNFDGSLDTSFNPGAGADNTIFSAALQPDGRVVIGGLFQNYNGTNRNRIARVNSDGSLDTTFNPGTGADLDVYTVALELGGRISVGGGFYHYNGTNRNSLAFVNDDGSLDTTFAPGSFANYIVLDSLAQPTDGKLIVSGQFTSVGGTPRNHIARLNYTVGSLDGSFSPTSGANGDISKVALQADGKIMIFGNFTSYNGVGVGRVTRINADGSWDTNYFAGAGADQAVYAGALLPDGRAVAGGDLLNFNGTPRGHLALLDTNGFLVTNFNTGAGADASVYSAAAPATGIIYVGGPFANFDGVARPGLARLLVNPVAIVVQPSPQTLLAGGNATFAATAAGYQPLACQWYLNSNAISGATNSSLTLSNVAPADAGNYQLVITNAFGSVTSSVAGLTVLSPPLVLSATANVTVAAGGTAALSVSVAGTGPFGYQWLFNGQLLPISGNIITVAGTGTTGYNGDSQAATNANLYSPYGVAVDGAGNLFIADTFHQRIRKVGTNGIITTVAGTGTTGYNGDNQAATNADLYNPEGVAVDGAGNLFISDTFDHRIRKVGTNGIITTVAGTGAPGYNGDNQAATSAGLYNPEGVAVDGSGNLFIADFNNQRIRKVGTNGIITTVAGNGGGGYNGDNQAATSATLAGPFGVAVDGSDNLFIAELSNYRIRKVDTNGIITTVAGTGAPGYNGDNQAATSAGLYNPEGVAVDGAGNLLIADLGNQRIRKVGTNGIITTVAGTGTFGYNGDNQAASLANLGNPCAATVDGAGNLFIVERDGERIRKVYGTTQFSQLGDGSLVISNVGLANIGNYSVIITNAYGGATSSLPSVAVSGLPLAFVTTNKAVSYHNRQFQFSLTAPAGSNVVVSAGTNLINWTPVVTNPASLGWFNYTDTLSTNFPRRFYKAQLQ